jgi:putative ABC transport system ATP-binding protein
MEILSRAGTALCLKGLVHARSHAGIRFELRVPDMCLAAGEFAAVVGPSGCGKSTLLDILGLVMQPDRADTYTLQDGDRLLDLTCMKTSARAAIRSQSIGYVLQTGGLLPFLTVRQNIALPLALNRLKDNSRIQELASNLGIAEQLDKRPAFLSGGQRQRAAIARALIHRPSLVLADEPTAAVDELTAMEIRDQFQSLSKTLGTTTIMVSHDRSLLRGRVDRIFSFRLERATHGVTISTLHEMEDL